MVEAHGTGTTLGDPIEAQALLATYGQGRASVRCGLGSIKSNIGHTQAAAGVAGVIKMVMAMRHGVLPQDAARRRALRAGRLVGRRRLAADRAAAMASASGEPRRAGVSSFGISGTNAHVILEEAPDAPSSSLRAGDRATRMPERSPRPRRRLRRRRQLAVPAWRCAAVGAFGARASRRCARRPSGWPAASERGSPASSTRADVGYSLAHSAAHCFTQRAVGASGADCARGCSRASRALARGRRGGRDQRGGARRPPWRWPSCSPARAPSASGMGRSCTRRSRSSGPPWMRLCAELDSTCGRPLREVLFAGMARRACGAIGSRRPTRRAALFALEVALFRLVESLGCGPDFLMGHSIGELSAAHVAGVFSLQDACRLVAARGRLMGELPAGGAMVSVQASEQEMRRDARGLRGAGRGRGGQRPCRGGGLRR